MRVDSEITTPASSFHLHTSLPLPSKLRQIDGLQVLRAIAVTLVAWGHSNQQVYSLGVVAPHFGIFGIDIFFVISGFIMSSIVIHTQTSSGATTAWSFFQRRIVRIYPIYWIIASLAIVRALHAHQPVLRFIPAFFLLPLPQCPLIYGLSWTLMFEMFFYTVMATLLLVTVRRSVHLAAAIFCISAIIGAIVGIHRPLWIIVCNPILLEFVFGAVIALAYRRFGTSRSVGITLLVLGVALSFYLRAYPPASATSMQMILAGQSILYRVATWGMTAALIVAGTVFWTPSITSRLGKIAVVVGNASYSAYLASPLVEEFTIRLILKIRPATHISFVAGIYYICILVLATLGMGWLCYQFVEWPLVRSIQSKLKTSHKSSARQKIAPTPLVNTKP